MAVSVSRESCGESRSEEEAREMPLDEESRLGKTKKLGQVARRIQTVR